MAEDIPVFDSVDDSRHGNKMIEVPPCQSLTSTETRLCKDHGRPFTFFCKSHVIELCNLCKLTVHRNCKRENVIDISQAVNETYSKMHGVNVKRGIQELVKELSECKYEALKTNNDLPTRKQSVIDRVKQTRTSIDAYLDKLEGSVIADIDTFYDNEDDVLSEQIQICEASITVLQKRMDSIERAVDAGNEIERFIEVNKATRETKEYFSVLQDVSQKIVRDDVTFKENEDFVELMNTSQNLGTVTVIRNDTIRGPVDWAFIYTRELIIKTEGKSDSNHIVRYDVLTDGRQLLLDNESRKLQMFTAANSLLAELTLPVTPQGLAVMSDTECLISTSHQRQFFSITIGESLKLTDTKTTHQSIGPMIKWGDNIIAVLQTGSQFSVSVIDRHGRIQRPIITDCSSLFEGPAFLALSADEKVVYVVDRAKGSIALALDGRKAPLMFKTEGNSDIVRYDVLTDGRQLLLDKENRKLQMFDAANSLLAELTLPVTPLGLAVMSDTECLISTSHQRQLFSITIGESLKLTDTKTTHQSIGPMIKWGDNIIAVLQTGSQFSVSVIDRQGRIQRPIITDDGSLFEWPDFLKLIANENMVYVVDRAKGSIALALDGRKAPLMFKTEGNSDIVRYGVLTDGRQLLLDNGSRKLQMFDAANSLLAELTLPVTPLGLAVMSDTECLISISHQRQLFSITICESLTISDTKTTHQSIGPMIKCGDNVIAVILTGSQFSISLINRQGRIQRPIITDDGSLFEWPVFLALSADEKTVYVLDRVKGCIALALDGRKAPLFHYEDSDSLGYAGLAVGQNCIYIGVEYKQTKDIIIRLLDCSGALLKDINCGNSYPLRADKNKLVTFNSQTGSINFHFIRV